MRGVDAAFPLGVFTAVTGVSGSGKSTLVGQVLAGALADRQAGEEPVAGDRYCATATGLEAVDRLVQVDQKPIGRTPRSNLATYTGLFDTVRKLFARTETARERGYGAGRFSFNVSGGRCETCQGEGFVSVELLFLPSTYAPCPDCHGARYNPETLEVTLEGLTIAQVLDLTVESAAEFFSGRLRPPSARCGPCWTWGSAICGSDSPPRSCRAARRSGSSWRPSSSAPGAVTRCICWTSRRRGCIRPMWRC